MGNSKKLVVSGSREFPELVPRLGKGIDRFIENAVIYWVQCIGVWYEVGEIVCGQAAAGVDAAVDRLMSPEGTHPGMRSLVYTPMPAAWDDLDAPGAVVKTNRSGKPYNVRAGYDRNTKMAEYVDVGLAIWNGRSVGTSHLVGELDRLGKPYVLVNLQGVT